MSKVMIVGAARDARTRGKRAQAGARKRKVRIGGVHLLRPSRSLAFSKAQCAKHEDELMSYWDAGLVLFQDGNGHPLEPVDVFGEAAVAAIKEALTEPEPVAEPVAVAAPEAAPMAATEPPPSDEDPEEALADALPEGYAEFTKKELIALFEGRCDVPEDTRNATLVEHLAAWEDANYE